MKRIKENFLSVLAVNCFFAISIIFIGPIEIFSVNTVDFEFSIVDFWKYLAAAGLFFIVVASIVMLLVPELMRKFMMWGIFSVTICCYLQSTFMNGKMQMMVGQNVTWSTGVKIVNLLIWFAIMLCVAMLIAKGKKYKTVLTYLAVCLLLTRVVSVTSVLLSTGALKENKSGYMSKDYMLDLSSKGDNVVVFLLDYFDGRVMDEILDKEPDFLNTFDGFVYYPNATSVHSRTYPSITYLFTEKICYFDKEPDDYIENAFNDGVFWKELVDANTNIGIYSYKEYFSHSARADMCNYYREKGTVNAKPLLKYMAKMVLYRDMPYAFKNRFTYDSGSINEEVICVSGDNKYLVFNDYWFDNTLDSEKVKQTIDENCFRFYHLGSCHLNFDNKAEAGKYALTIVNDYCRQMKEMGIYKDSTIIILADHGFSGEGDTLDMPHQTAVPLMLVKQAGSADTKLVTSNAPVSQTEFAPTVLEAFGLEYSGRSFEEIGENENRDRYYYYSAMYDNLDGEIELREYKVDGDARKPESYKFTGNTWDIIYSQNKVKK